ncbi:hypothetical protein EYF80_047206 [Liparis tanakae]|uniref:Uncharacterized protein n=1 Tax=Liparis tanakae TaxID=230148 RepID=A0A4Z2FQH9_9TELE|nr:hypothetical protein EYF80_047206 [Liparis tanakae]
MVEVSIVEYADYQLFICRIHYLRIENAEEPIKCHNRRVASEGVDLQSSLTLRSDVIFVLVASVIVRGAPLSCCRSSHRVTLKGGRISPRRVKRAPKGRTQAGGRAGEQQVATAARLNSRAPTLRRFEV